MLGVPASECAGFGPNDQSLDISSDGARIVFMMLVKPQSGGEGQRAFSVNADGSGIHDYLGRASFVLHVAMSGDGSWLLLGSTSCLIHLDGSGMLQLAAGAASAGPFPAAASPC